jgi:hypothetical protein
VQAEGGGLLRSIRYSHGNDHRDVRRSARSAFDAGRRFDAVTAFAAIGHPPLDGRHDDARIYAEVALERIVAAIEMRGIERCDSKLANRSNQLRLAILAVRRRD